MYSRILIAYDGSDSAPHVLEQALILARSEQAALDIVTVIPRYQGNLRLLGNTGVLEAMADQYRNALDNARDAARAGGVRARVHLREGEADDEVPDLAEELGADLVVIGKRARFLLDHMPIGLTAIAIFKNSPVDVLVVAGNKALHLDRLFLACQPSAAGGPAADRAASIAARYASSLTIGIAYDPGLKAFALASHFEEAMQRQAKEEALKAAGIAEAAGVRHVKTVIKRGDPWYKTLGEEATAAGAGLIISGLDSEHGLSRLLPGAGTGRLVGFSPCPVLIAKKAS